MSYVADLPEVKGPKSIKYISGTQTYFLVTCFRLKPEITYRKLDVPIPRIINIVYVINIMTKSTYIDIQ